MTDPMRRLMAVRLVALAGLTAPFWPAAAGACSFIPTAQHSTVLPNDGGHLPANVSALIWRPSDNDFTGLAPKLQSVDSDGTKHDLDFDLVAEERSTALPADPQSTTVMRVTVKTGLWIVRIRTPLRAGTQLIFCWEDLMRAQQPRVHAEVRLTVGEAAPLPDTLGALAIQTALGTVVVGSRGGECARQVDASYADIDLRLSQAAKPYADLLRYELRLDGDEPWQYIDSIISPTEPRLGSSSLGPEKDRVVVSCTGVPLLGLPLSAYRTPPTLEPGTHRVRMVGVLPDGSELSSQEVEVDLPCPNRLLEAQQAAAGAGAPAQLPQARPAAHAAGGGSCSALPGQPRARAAALASSVALVWLGLLGRRRSRRRR
jgi:hypothetical protein